MDLQYEAIVVGGGPGGLAIGALLSKRGLKTAVLEKNPWLGGRYRSIDRVNVPTADSKADTFILELALRYEFNPERI